MRQFGEVPPVLSTVPAPVVASVTGLGTGGGAGVSTPDGQGFGKVNVMAGVGPSAAGNVVLNSASNWPQMFVSGELSFGALTVSGTGTTSLTIAWTAANLKNPTKPYELYYEWFSSR